MNKLTPNLLQQLIKINLSARKDHLQEEMHNHNFSQEFKTIKPNLGRQTGHTHSMLLSAFADDLILLQNGRMIDHLRVAYFINSEITTWGYFESDSAKYLQTKRRYIWVDTASYGNPKKVISLIQANPNAYDALILLG